MRYIIASKWLENTSHVMDAADNAYLILSLSWRRNTEGSMA